MKYQTMNAVLIKNVAIKHEGKLYKALHSITYDEEMKPLKFDLQIENLDKKNKTYKEIFARLGDVYQIDQIDSWSDEMLEEDLEEDL